MAGWIQCDSMQEAGATSGTGGDGEGGRTAVTVNGTFIGSVTSITSVCEQISKGMCIFTRIPISIHLNLFSLGYMDTYLYFFINFHI
jgi:hypothetical protein